MSKDNSNCCKCCKENKKILNQILKVLKGQDKNISIDDFTIKGQPKACEILRCSRPTLIKAIKDEILKEKLDYTQKTIGDKKYYTFSYSSLEKYKGKL